MAVPNLVSSFITILDPVIYKRTIDFTAGDVLLRRGCKTRAPPLLLSMRLSDAAAKAYSLMYNDLVLRERIFEGLASREAQRKLVHVKIVMAETNKPPMKGSPLQVYPDIKTAFHGRPARGADGTLTISCHLQRTRWPISSAHKGGRMRFAVTIAGETIFSNAFIIMSEQSMAKVARTGAVPVAAVPVPQTVTIVQLKNKPMDSAHGPKRPREEE